MQAYLFNDYWEDIGTIRSFFEANLALTEHVSIPDPHRNLPPSIHELTYSFSHGSLRDSAFMMQQSQSTHPEETCHHRR